MRAGEVPVIAFTVRRLHKDAQLSPSMAMKRHQLHGTRPIARAGGA